MLFSTQCFADVEPWYINMGLGTVSFDHPAQIESAMSRAASYPGNSRSQLSLDMFGLYFPLAPTTAVGFAITSEADRISNDYYGDSVQLNTYLTGVSAMQYFGEEIGDGLFLRGDIGSAKAAVVYDNGVSTSTSTSDTGNGYLLGVGYGFVLSPGARLLLTLSMTNKSIEGETYKATRTTIGLIW